MPEADAFAERGTSTLARLPEAVAFAERGTSTLARLPEALAFASLRAQVEARLQLLQAAVARRLSPTAAAPSVDPAAPAIATALGEGRTVAEVAWDLGYSERQLHRRSLLAFGYAPKTLQRIIRFQHALRLARTGIPLAQVAITAGYTDQAHLSNDVKRLSGVQLSRLL
ncbi:helix-turn-helix domain-containing protein [Nonomuraea sp. PA05]|nr:helix-turn-helix domain-containing protein [Nonomuraea sp. PA05]